MPAGPVGTSGSTPSPTATTTDAAAKAEAVAGEAKYVLANAVSSPADAAKDASKPSTPRTYRLIANDAALAPHVGKKLELTGAIEDQEGSRASSSESTPSSTSASAASAPRLKVEAGKVLADSCTP